MKHLNYPEDYQALRRQTGSYYEVELVLRKSANETRTYGIDELKSVKIEQALFQNSGPQIGNANATQCKVKLLERSANWPRMARFEIRVRLSDANGQQKSQDWVSYGRFYTDQRSEDKYGNLEITAFDGMLKMEKSWTDRVPDSMMPSSWPITARAWATMIQNAGLATFANLNQLDNSVAFIGLKTATTIRDVLKYIASAHGGNWQMNNDEALTLVQFANPPAIGPEQTTSNYVYVGLSMRDFWKSPSLDAIKSARLEAESGLFVEAGTDNGYQIHGACEFATTSGVAELCLSRTQNYVYKPFEIQTGRLDPITEVGDFVVADGQIYQVMSISWNVNTWPTADVSAPYDEEVDHEYTVLSKEAKNYRKTMADADEKYLPRDEFSTAIEQNAEAITLVASHTFVSQLEYDEEIQQLQSQIDGSIQTWSGNVVPTLNNSPASDWTTDLIKAEHVGDLYFINSDAQIPEAGQYYRFEKSGNTYTWSLLTDSAMSEALNQAAAAMAAAEAAQSTADSASTTAASKGKIWLVRPTPPYSEGDLWFDYGGEASSGEILTCINSRSSGNYNAADWEKRNKYTDDAAFFAFQAAYQNTINDITEQLDKKAETYYQEADPVVSWGNLFPVGVFVVGVNKVGATGSEEHKGDLWYRTSDNTTWYWDGSKWIQQNVPDDVFDKIDGKAQIFISTPYTPYHIGDLWFNSASSDIMTCIKDRATGEYVASDWTKRNKYTDDTKANEVQGELNTYKTTVQSEFTVQNNKISAKVSKTGGVNTSFGWTLTDTEHSWFANSKEVLQINDSGLTVYGNGEFSGKITAKEGYIGTEQRGFVITAKALYNGTLPEGSGGLSASNLAFQGVYVGTDGILVNTDERHGFSASTSGAVSIRYNMSQIDDTPVSGGSQTNGVYLGTNGISLGFGNFKVTTAGVASFKKGSISLGKVYPNDNTSNLYRFSVNDRGEVTAKALSLTRTVTDGGGEYEETIFKINQSGRLEGDFTGGYFKIGDKILLTSNGNLTLGGFRVESSKLYSWNTSGGSKDSMDAKYNGVYIGTNGIALGYNSTTKTTPFSVTSSGAVSASNLSLTGGSITIKDSKGNVAFSVSSTGAVTATNMSITGGSININNGAFTVDANGNLSASSGSFGGTIYAANLQGTVTQEQLATAVQNALTYAKNYNKATSASPSATETPAQFTAHALYATPTTPNGNSGGYVQASRYMAISTGASGWGYDAALQDTLVPTAAHWHTFSEGTGSNAGKIFIGKAIPATSDYQNNHFFKIADTQYYKNGVSAAKPTSILVSRETADADIGWNATQKKLSADYTLTAKNSANKEVLKRTGQTISIPATKAFNAGQDYGAGTVTVLGSSDMTITTQNSHKTSGLHHYVNVDITPTARATKSNGTYKTATNTINRDINVDQVFSDGVSAAKPTSILVSRETADADIGWNATTKKLSANYTLTAKNAANEEVLKRTGQSISMPATKAFNAGQDYGAGTVTVLGTSNMTITTQNAHKTSGSHHYVNVDITPTARATKSDGTYKTATNTINRDINADKVYSDGVSAGYNSGVETAAVDSVSTSSKDDHKTSGSHHYVSVDITAKAKGTYYDGSKYTASSQSIASGRYILADAVYSAGYTAGAGSASQKDISSIGETSYSTTADFSFTFDDAYLRYSDGYLKGRASISFSDGSSDTVFIEMDGTRAYDAGHSDGVAAGYNSGVETAAVDSVSIISNNDHTTSGSHHYVSVDITANAKGTYYNGSKYTAESQDIASGRLINADKVYSDGQESITNDNDAFFDYFTPVIQFEYWYDFWDNDLQETRTVGYIRGGVLRKSDGHFFETNGRWVVEVSGFHYSDDYIYVE